MNRIGIVLIVIFVLFTGITSCADDDRYSLDDAVVYLATLNYIDESAGTYYLTMDNGKTLLPNNHSLHQKLSNGQRVLVNFTLIEDSISGYDNLIRINNLREILTKRVEELTVDNEEEIGNDPVKILALWVGDNYLNIHFGYDAGGQQKHRLSLVQNKVLSGKGGEEIVALEFRHNAYADPRYYGVKGYAAYDLKSLQVDNRDSVILLIKVLNVDNEIKEYKVAYKNILKMPESINNF